MRFRTIVFLVLVALGVAAAAAAEDRYKVIAHPSVPVTSIEAKELSLLFLKKTTTYEKWGNAQKVVPFDLDAGSAAREAFSTSTHGKPVAAIKSYWQQQIFSGRGTPPAELASDADVIASVARTPGGIGYVSATTALPDNVKAIRVTK